MNPNGGGINCIVWIVAGPVLLALVFVLEGNARWWGLIGILPLSTGLSGWCPAYLPFGINACATKEKRPG